MREVLRHVIESIGPASEAHAEGARANIAAAQVPLLERLAMRLGGAQHTARPLARGRLIVVVAGDHGCGDPGIAMGPDHPTIVAARAIAEGSAALALVARSSQTPIVLVDAGARERAHMPKDAVALGRGPTHDLMNEPAMTIVDAALGLEAGIALAVSLAEPRSAMSEARAASVVELSAREAELSAQEASLAELSAREVELSARAASVVELSARAASVEPSSRNARLAVLAIGAIGVGSEVASAALLGALTGKVPTGLGDDVAELAGARGARIAGAGALELLAAFGGPETAVLAGLILGAASMNTVVILDGHATGAAALIATALAPYATDYLVAAHRGGFTQPAILAHLGLQSIFEVGLGHGEGTGAAMVIPLIDQVAAVTGRG